MGMTEMRNGLRDKTLPSRSTAFLQTKWLIRTHNWHRLAKVSRGFQSLAPHALLSHWLHARCLLRMLRMQVFFSSMKLQADRAAPRLRFVHLESSVHARSLVFHFKFHVWRWDCDMSDTPFGERWDNGWRLWALVSPVYDVVSGVFTWLGF